MANHQSPDRTWQVLSVAMGVLCTLGLAGFNRYGAWHDLPYTLLDKIYLTLQLIPMNSGGLESPIPFELELARFGIPLVAAFAAIKAFWNIFSEQIRMVRLRSIRDHIVICGLSRKGYLLASQFAKRGDRVVVIERDKGNIWLESCQGTDILVLAGDASKPGLLKRAGVARARAVFAVCDEDGINAEISLHIKDLVSKREDKPLSCMAHISSPQLCALLRERKASLETGSFHLELFNLFERGARLMLNTHPAWESKKIITPPQLLVIGLGRMGASLVLHLSRDWWNEQAFCKQPGKLRIVIIDKAANEKAALLHARHPQLNRACELVPLQMEIQSAAFEGGGFLINRETAALDRAYICLDDDGLAFQAALVLAHHNNAGNLPVIIRISEEGGLAKLLENHQDAAGGHASLFAFGWLERTCSPALLAATARDLLARAAHEGYLVRQSESGQDQPVLPVSKPWEQLEESYREENYRWVDRIQSHLTRLGYKISPLLDWDAPSYKFPAGEVEEMARWEHAQWRTQKEADGWRYSPGKQNEQAKTNPDLVDWEQLPEGEKEKNRQFIRNIPRFLGNVDFQVARE